MTGTLVECRPALSDLLRSDGTPRAGCVTRFNSYVREGSHDRSAQSCKPACGLSDCPLAMLIAVVEVVPSHVVYSQMHRYGYCDPRRVPWVVDGSSFRRHSRTARGVECRAETWKCRCWSLFAFLPLLSQRRKCRRKNHADGIRTLVTQVARSRRLTCVELSVVNLLAYIDLTKHVASSARQVVSLFTGRTQHSVPSTPQSALHAPASYLELRAKYDAPLLSTKYFGRLAWLRLSCSDHPGCGVAAPSSTIEGLDTTRCGRINGPQADTPRSVVQLDG
jgi:hypothetical protein